MSKKEYSRRSFIKQNAMIGLGTAVGVGMAPSLFAGSLRGIDTPAILGGSPVRTKGWPKWPMWIQETDEKRVLETLRSGVWSRASVVTEFEKKWAETIGTKRALATTNGTGAMIASLTQLNVGCGDEVIIPPYTFIATLAAVLATGAMPVFADIDPETFQIDPKKIEAKITPRTRAILPVHICGLPADMVRIMQIAKKHNLVVVEDACQAWLAEINHQKVGTFGNTGCFSFQNSKNIPIGEGGAIVSNDEELMDKCYSYHNYGDPYGTAGARPGVKLRMTEYQAAIGLAQLTRLESQTTIRIANAEYLKSQLKNIPGIIPYKLYDNVTRPAFHLFPFRYKKEAFHDLPKADFLKALKAEGISCSAGYKPLNTALNLGNTFETKNYQKMYPKEMLDMNRYLAQNKCPENDRLCAEEAVWFTQNMLLTEKADMNDISNAIARIQKNAESIKKLTASK
jgi:perosamine synthetase